MYVPNPWAKHFQSAWENRAADANLPPWTRVASLAYARHEANGHANFQTAIFPGFLGSRRQTVAASRGETATRSGMLLLLPCGMAFWMKTLARPAW
jgi:hypothetical protein